MLEIIIPATEIWDESKNEFVYTKEQILRLEHSLVSLSKWERKYCKRFLDNKEKTIEETIDYVRFMTINKNVDPNVYSLLSKKHLDQIYRYIEAPMTATILPANNNKNQVRGEPVTCELIYYWMISFNIPIECQKWHLNSLLTLIKVFEIKNSPKKKMSSSELAMRNAKLNAARRKQLNSKG